MTDTEIKNEIVGIIDGRNDRMPANWIVQEFMAQHEKPQGAEADFYLLCAYSHVRAIVRQTLQRMRAEETDEQSPQLVLDGFERLQRRYIVEHKGELQAVPVEQMTLEEIDQKIGELRRMAAGCLAHANELERYLRQRQAA